ncbi:MAG: hypothetical protein ACPGTP_05470 [Bacteroidia bacterium]
MKSTLLSFALLSICSGTAIAQNLKNELGVSLFSIQSMSSVDHPTPVGMYINPINAVVYKRTINMDVKLRGIVSAEINSSMFPEFNEVCKDCGEFFYISNSVGVSGGIQKGRQFGKFSPYGYVDLFYKLKYESLDYENYSWGTNIEKFSKKIASYGTTVGFGLEYNFTKHFSIIWEPSFSLAQLNVNGEGFSSNRNTSEDLIWADHKELDLNMRGVNIFSINAKF